MRPRSRGVIGSGSCFQVCVCVVLGRVMVVCIGVYVLRVFKHASVSCLLSLSLLSLSSLSLLSLSFSGERERCLVF